MKKAATRLRQLKYQNLNSGSVRTKGRNSWSPRVGSWGPSGSLMSFRGVRNLPRGEGGIGHRGRDRARPSCSLTHPMSRFRL